MKESLYSPLSPGLRQEIRLLELLPDEGSGIVCKFHVKPVANAGSFIALSYTWGEPLPTREIQLDGHPIPIRLNLFEALHAIRTRLKVHSNKKAGTFAAIQQRLSRANAKESCSKYGKHGTPYLSEQDGLTKLPLLWIDQLCINQSDMNERSSQVQLMSSIYSTARIVLVWLGKPVNPEAAHGAIACLEATNRAVAKGKDSKHWSRPTGAQREVIHDVSKNRYWTRVWIVQEIMLANKTLVQLGDVIFDYKELMPLFIRGPGNVQLNQTFAYDNFSRWDIEQTPMGRLLWTKTTLQEVQKTSAKVTVHLLLTLLENQQCSDKRDKVYGLLGLVQGTDDRPQVRADYSLHPEDVYQSVLQNAFESDFPDASRALDLCRKAGIALGIDWKNEVIVRATTDLLLRVVGDKPATWSHNGTEILRNEVMHRVRDCVWTARLEDIVAKLLPSVSYNLKRGQRGW
jgi:hypothetical protein